MAATSKRRRKIILNLTCAAGTGTVTIPQIGEIQRTVFLGTSASGASAATYDWYIKDADADVVALRTGQVGDKAIVEDYPIQTSGTLLIVNSTAASGVWKVVLWVK